jgi:chromatin licensing and DNA replication factor 1
MSENIYKFIKKKKVKKSIKECDMSTEIIVKEIDVKKYKIDFINMIKEESDKEESVKKESDKEESDKEESDKEESKKDESVMEEMKSKKDESVKKESKEDEEMNKNLLSLRDRVLNFKNINRSEIKFNSIDKHLRLPKKYLNLTRIFRVMLTIQKYNINRGLSNIFSKCKKCIEDVLKFRVSINDVEKIRYLIREDIIIKEVEIDDIKTFTYLLNCTVEDFDKKVWEYYQNNKDKEEIKEREIEGIKEREIEGIKEREIEGIKEREIEEDNKKFIKKEEGNKFTNILDRIKERERLRKEEFIKRSKEEDNSVFLKKIDMYFKKENKTCIKISEIIKVFNLYDGERYLRNVSEKEKVFDIKEILGEEYLIIRK